MTDKRTPEVAIAHIEEILSEVPNYDESLDYELSSYDFDWLEEAKKALEKQIPKKPLSYKGLEGKCPTCGVIFLDRSTNHCGNCGQALDWSE